MKWLYFGLQKTVVFHKEEIRHPGIGIQNDFDKFENKWFKRINN